MAIVNPLLQSKIPSLDGLRAVSIAFVLICHLAIGTPYDAYLRPLGPIGVEIFFVISGFLITTLLLKEKLYTGKISLKNFYMRRFLRIVPLIVLFVFVLTILNVIFSLHITSTSFLTSLLFLKNLPIPNSQESYSDHLWSLGIEEQYYLIFPFLLSWLSIKMYKRIVIVLIAVLPILSFLFSYGFFDTPKVVHDTVMAICDVFGHGTASILVGSLSSVILFEHPEKVKNVSGNRYLSLLVFPIALAIGHPLFPGYISFVSDVVFAGIVAIFIILNLNTENKAAKFLNNKIAVQIGVLSYSIYIWQQWFTLQKPWSKAFHYADNRTLNLVGLFIVSYLSYYLYEKKFLNLKKRFKIV